MSDVKHILLVPTEEHREALLGDGPCGSRAPKAWWDDRHEDDGGQCWIACRGARAASYERIASSHALALAWDGKPTGPEGLARALAVLCPARAKRNRTFRVYAPGSLGSTLAGWTADGTRIDRPNPAGWEARVGWDGPSTFGGESFPYDLPTPPDGLGDLLDLWALAVVGEARGLWRAEVVR